MGYHQKGVLITMEVEWVALVLFWVCYICR